MESNDAAAAKIKEAEATDKGVELIEKQMDGIRFSSNDEPPEVQRRIKAMKRLQVELLEAECQFFKDLHLLETEYSTVYKKLCEKRNSIITGKHEPTDEECVFCIPSDEGDSKKDENKQDAVAPKELPNPVNGIPRFWLTVFQNVPQITEMIEDPDVPILEHLEDVRVELTKEPLGFQLEFKFSPNAFFTNAVLTKSYEMRCVVDPKDPFSFEGPEIVKSIGCSIDWKDGKNVTVREVKKKQKHKQSGAIRTVTKNEPCESFFNFFNPPQIDDTADEEDGEMDRMTTDFQVGQYLRERVVPRAVLYYTGEIPVSDDEDDDYSSEADSDEESEEGSESGTTAGEDDDKDKSDEKGDD